MNVKKVGKSWAYDFYYEGERHRQGRFKTKREAQEAANELYSQLSQGYRLDKDVPFIDYFNYWLKATKEGKVSDDTYARFIRAGKVFEEKFGLLPVNKLTRTMYQELINEYSKGMYLESKKANSKESKEKERKGRSRSAVEKLHYCLRESLRDAHHEGLMLKDPTYNIDVSGTVAPKKESAKFMTLNQFKALKQHAMSKNELSYLCIYILTVTGARFGEVSKLKLNDIDVNNNTIHIRGTKTENADRVVLVSEKDIKHIMGVIKSRPVNISGYIFDTGFNVITNAAVTKVLKDFLLENRYGKYTLHALRHTHCSMLIYYGFDIYYISKRMGHANISITQSIYGHLLKEREHENDKLIDSVLAAL